MIGYDEYRLGSGQAGKYRIGLNIVRTGEIGVKGLFLEYGEYSAEYSPTPSLKPLSWVRIFCGGVVIISRVGTYRLYQRVCWLLRVHMSWDRTVYR